LQNQSGGVGLIVFAGSVGESSACFRQKLNKMGFVFEDRAVAISKATGTARTGSQRLRCLLDVTGAPPIPATAIEGARKDWESTLATTVAQDRRQSIDAQTK